MILSRTASEADRKLRPGFDAGVSDILIMTLSLLAGVVGCLARPCKPENWAYVKAARTHLDATPQSAHEPGSEPAPVSEPGFADGLVAAA